MVSEPIYRVYRFGEERKKRKVIRSRIERNQSEEKKRSNSIYNPNPSKAKRKGAARLPGHHRRLERRLPPRGEPQWRRLTGASPPSCGKGTRAAAVLLHRACGLRAKGTAPKPLDGGALPLRRARAPARGPVAAPPSSPATHGSRRAREMGSEGKKLGFKRRAGVAVLRRRHGAEPSSAALDRDGERAADGGAAGRARENGIRFPTRSSRPAGFVPARSADSRPS